MWGLVTAGLHQDWRSTVMGQIWPNTYSCKRFYWHMATPVCFCVYCLQLLSGYGGVDGFYRDGWLAKSEVSTLWTLARTDSQLLNG